MAINDPLSRLHWDAICAQHADPNSERTKKAIADYNQALDEWLDMLFKPMMASLDATAVNIEVDKLKAKDLFNEQVQAGDTELLLTCRCLHTQAWHKHDPNSDRCHYYHCECKHFELINIELVQAMNALPTPSLTLEVLLQMAQAMPQVPPLPCPNPCDVHPQTYELLRKALHVQVRDSTFTVMHQPGFNGIEVHLRTDVEPGYLHPCRCQDPELNK